MKYIKKDDLFYLNKPPSISIENYITRFFIETKMSISSLILAIIYMDKFVELNKYVLSLYNIHRIFLSACLLSIKFNEDMKISEKYYANIAGVTINELKNLELSFYSKLNFSLFVDCDYYQQYFNYLYKL